MKRCAGYTLKGIRCKKKAEASDKYCYLHLKQQVINGTTFDDQQNDSGLFCDIWFVVGNKLTLQGLRPLYLTCKYLFSFFTAGYITKNPRYLVVVDEESMPERIGYAEDELSNTFKQIRREYKYFVTRGTFGYCEAKFLEGKKSFKQAGLVTLVNDYEGLQMLFCALAGKMNGGVRTIKVEQGRDAIIPTMIKFARKRVINYVVKDRCCVWMDPYVIEYHTPEEHEELRKIFGRLEARLKKREAQYKRPYKILWIDDEEKGRCIIKYE